MMPPGLCGYLELVGRGVFGFSALELSSSQRFDTFLDRRSELVVLPIGDPDETLTVDTWHPTVAAWLGSLTWLELDVVLPDGIGAGRLTIQRVQKVAQYFDAPFPSRWRAYGRLAWHRCTSLDCRSGHPVVATRGMLCDACSAGELEVHLRLNDEASAPLRAVAVALEGCAADPDGRPCPIPATCDPCSQRGIFCLHSLGGEG